MPFVKADATKFSETGYVGSDVEDLVRDLVKAANGDIELAEKGIIFIDEIDKIASEGSAGGRDVSAATDQLTQADGGDRGQPLQPKRHDGADAGCDGNPTWWQASANRSTQKISFIVSGAFDKLAELIKKRVSQNEMALARM